MIRGVDATDVTHWGAWAEAVYAPSTVRLTRVAARSVRDLAGVDVEAADVDDVDRWWTLLRRSPQTRVSYLDGLRRFYSWRATRDPHQLDPTRYLARPAPRRRLPRPVDAAVVEHALAITPQPAVTWLGLAAWAGLRRSEIAALRPRDVWADHGGLTLRIAGKGGRERVVPVPERLGQLLAGYGWPQVSASTVYVHVRRALSAAGDPAGAPHRLRHSYATEVYGSSTDLLAVAALLGHETVATTQVYAQVSDRHLRGVVTGAFHVGDAREAAPLGAAL